MTRVSELMSSPVVTCAAGTTLGELATILAARRIHGLVVVDESGRAAGVVADTDVLAGEWLATDEETLATMRAMTAGELMTSPPVAIDADAPVAEAAARLRDERLARLVVVRDGAPVGVLAISDLVRDLGRGHLGRGTVADVMSHGLVACRDGTTVRQAARVMTERHVRALVVVAADGRPLGVVTGTDLLPLVGADAGNRPVAELMHPPITIGPAASLREAADLLLEHEIHRLVVVDPDDPDAVPLGVVATTDIVAEMAEPGSVWR
ncbi:MAG TPA: CBS domain-containing protein [Gaiellaceae bacterium]|nr:CBS domain-containing protein [Gaiellaceae bacterium]